MHYVVIGAGPAGVTAVETLRKADASAEVTLIGGEPEPAYSRMAIPYYLAKHIDETGTYLRPQSDHFSSLAINQVNAKVTSINPADKNITLENNQVAEHSSPGVWDRISHYFCKKAVSQDGADETCLHYDKLLIATGSQAVAPPIKGLDQPGIYHCWTLDDARNIAAEIGPGKKVVLMGAGFIGCIIMESLVECGVDLTVVEMGDRMVPRMMDQAAGNMIKTWCQEKGVNVHTSTRVVAVEADATGKNRFQVQCDPVDALTADLIVVATGVKPLADFLQGSGVHIEQGVLVDEYQQTNVADIYAAGDVCEGADWNTGNNVVHAIQPVAVETARIAALNMSGSKAAHPGSLVMNVLDTLGLISTSYGLWSGVEGGSSCKLIDEQRFRYINLQFDGDHLVGAITLGITEHVGVLRGLIQSRTQLGEWKQRLMDDPTRFMEAYLASTHFSDSSV